MPGVLSSPKASCLPLVLLLPEPGAPVINVPSTKSRSRSSSLSESDNIGRSRLWFAIEDSLQKARGLSEKAPRA